MADSPAYQSGLIAALRGSSPNDAPTTPGIQFLPNAPMAPFNPMSFGAPQMSGNLMVPPALQQGAPAQPRVRETPQQTVNFMGLPLPVPPGVSNGTSQPRMGVTPGPMAQMPSLTGNLMPVPDQPRAPDYVPPPPKPAPVQPPAPQINYEMDENGNRTGAIIGINADGEPYRYFPSFE